MPFVKSKSSENVISFRFYDCDSGTLTAAEFIEFGYKATKIWFLFISLPPVTAPSVKQNKALYLHWDLIHKPFFFCVASYKDGIERIQSILFFFLYF